MITNTGQSILAKYLVGQAPAYASYIAIGCGAKPVSSSHQFSNNEIEVLKDKTSLDFEMFRIPVTSRGYVVENGVSKIVFTGELPTLERYKITEVGLWSAGSNPSAKFNDSRNILLFNEDEGWQHNNNVDNPVDLTTVSARLDSGLDGKIDRTEKAFITNADNITFANTNRTRRYEGARFLNSLIALRGDLSKIIVNEDGKLSVEDGFAEHLRLTGATLDFDKSSPKDELRLAFSVINKDSESQKQPYDVKILLEFSDKDVFSETDREYARFETVISSLDQGVDFANQRYFVSTARFEELNRSSGFTWKIADVVKVYVTISEKDPVTENISISNNYYVCLDALRVENTQNQNPIYGLTGYSVIKTIDSQPVTKIANSSNHIEFRFGLDVL